HTRPRPVHGYLYRVSDQWNQWGSGCYGWYILTFLFSGPFAQPICIPIEEIKMGCCRTRCCEYSCSGCHDSRYLSFGHQYSGGLEGLADRWPGFVFHFWSSGMGSGLDGGGQFCTGVFVVPVLKEEYFQFYHIPFHKYHSGYKSFIYLWSGLVYRNQYLILILCNSSFFSRNYLKTVHFLTKFFKIKIEEADSFWRHGIHI